ncbi:hypothetical protein GGX14DRAFT_400869 [Mycena pura]|uniref:Uncharacterized protein n=1 Tax=Mycena pura TaxID=153505 RepID=A0AAD6V1S4_9AGAR|nr:hypothetical protein GGX14DRAFT_400869 [Mycena pura]
MTRVKLVPAAARGNLAGQGVRVLGGEHTRTHRLGLSRCGIPSWERCAIMGKSGHAAAGSAQTGVAAWRQRRRTGRSFGLPAGRAAVAGQSPNTVQPPAYQKGIVIYPFGVSGRCRPHWERLDTMARKGERDGKDSSGGRWAARKRGATDGCWVGREVQTRGKRGWACEKRVCDRAARRHMEVQGGGQRRGHAAAGRIKKRHARSAQEHAGQSYHQIDPFGPAGDEAATGGARSVRFRARPA